MNHLVDFDNEELLEEYTNLFRHEDMDEEAALGSRPAEMRAELLRRMTAADESHCRMGVRCPEHDNQVHGQEASELRVELEKFIERVEDYESWREVADELQKILDRVDCRDSFAYEQKNDQQARREQADKVSLSVEGLDLLLKLRMLEDDNHPTTKSLKEMGLLVSMVNPDGVSLSILGAKTLEKLDAADEEPKSRFQSTAFLATDIETEGV